ncbi:hypothetical protein HaloA020_04930 [Halomonas sp. A020]|nr:hypothetical protein HaloA020_04930 [Halomonas sp. A020]
MRSGTISTSLLDVSLGGNVDDSVDVESVALSSMVAPAVVVLAHHSVIAFIKAVCGGKMTNECHSVVI